MSSTLKNLNHVIDRIGEEMAEYTWAAGEKPSREWFELYHIEKDLRKLTLRLKYYKTKYSSQL